MHRRTGYRWCWWLRNAALSYEIGRQLEGAVEAEREVYAHQVGEDGFALLDALEASPSKVLIFCSNFALP